MRASPTSASKVSGMASSPVVVRNLGISGHEPIICERLKSLLEHLGVHTGAHDHTGLNFSGDEHEMNTRGVWRNAPGAIPSVLMGDLRAGNGRTTPQTIEFCRRYGVQTFSVQYTGGESGAEARLAAEGAADFEHEDVSCSADLVLAGCV